MAPTQHNTYGPGHALPQVQHHEWRTAENSAAHLIPHLKTSASQNPHLKMLDVGAGSGTITASLANYMPEGQITATDISDDILQRARFHAEKKGVKNISYQRASAYELPFPESSFDVTHAHQVLTHLDAPVDAIREMLRVTKPGGIVSLREADMRMWCFWPEIPALQQFHELNVQQHISNGASGTAGRELLSWALKAGAQRENVEMSFGTWCYGSAGDRKPWSDSMVERLQSGPVWRKALEDGTVKREEVEEMIDAWKTWAATDDAVLGIMNGEAIIRKA
ncbi:methylase involved in ubiquinone/menaquinone biosynthesis [Metarhizium acridum CQMa 102]|uniref:Methylase involved in ubiquinone/menaquinone biosynthesis n=2 Tax=Metarhizium acridum TaxID=92637 RepID=E9ECZ9_METAQ|nr:methylase involved in ubiquinone/menaquinone biosynthesis [Metarhizium acridum CQMa 102]EFY86224.1 methylase involved in ubiquinone/menaquinone biosynthesis [Metarhizium acridum CQMa 102]